MAAGDLQLTPAVLSKLPLGLLGFFGIKNGGKYPQFISEQILTTLDQAGLLAANYIERHVFSVQPTTSGLKAMTDVVTGLPAVVPAGEIWFCQAISITTFTGAGDSVTWVPCITNFQLNGPNTWLRALAPSITQAASTNSQAPSVHVAGLWASPNDSFGANVNAVTSATGIFTTMHVSYVRFPF